MRNRNLTDGAPAREVGQASLPATSLALLLFLLIPSFAIAQQPPSYSTDIAPLLSKNCAGCHSPKTKMGGLVLDTYDNLRKGGTHGHSFISGKSAESRLYQMVAGDMEPRMPFSADPLKLSEIALIKRWIDAGAPGPKLGETVAVVEPAELPKIEPAVPVKAQIFSLDYHPGGQMIALGQHRRVILASAETGKEVSRLEGLSDVARGVTFSPDGKLLAAGSGLPGRGGEVVIWDVASRRRTQTIEGHGDTVYEVAFSPDGKMLASSSYDKTVKLWDVDSGAELRTLEDHIDAVYALEFTADGRWLISGSADRSLKIWVPSTGERLYTLNDPIEGVNSIAIHPSGRRVVAGGHDRTIRIWELDEGGGQMVNSLIAHQSAILRVAFSPDGKTLVTASADNTIKIFDAGNLDEIATIDNQPDWVMSLEFSPDGTQFAAGRFDGSLSIYNTDNFRDQLEVLHAGRSTP